MINAEGQRVEAVPDMASWEQYKAKAEALATKKDDSVADSKEIEERGLACPIDKRIFVEPMKTPCCGRTYCNDCIENALVNSDLVCPGCESEGVLFDNLTQDDDMIVKIKKYQEEKTSKSQSLEVEKSKQSPPPSSNETRKSASPAPASNPRKRSAEDDLPNNRQKTKSPPGGILQSPQEKAKSPRLQPKSPKDKLAPKTIPVGPKSDQDFVKQMNELVKQHGMKNPMNEMPMPNGFPPFPMPNMMGMPNPMMLPPNGMNPFSMGMMPFPGLMPGNNGNMNFNGNGMNDFNNGWINAGNPAPPTEPKAHRNQFSHQQAAGGGDDEDAYMRKPLNPNRVAHKNRRARPTDYKELGA